MINEKSCEKISESERQAIAMGLERVRTVVDA